VFAGDEDVAPPLPGSYTQGHTSAAVDRRFSRWSSVLSQTRAVLKHTHSPAAAGLRATAHVRARAASVQGLHLSRPKVDAHARRRDGYGTTVHESVDIQRLNAHGDREPLCSRRRESALIPAFDEARWRRLIPRCGAATQPRFMGSIDIQRLNAHGDREPLCSRRRESALIPAFDGARWRRLIPRCGAATQPRFMGSGASFSGTHCAHEPASEKQDPASCSVPLDAEPFVRTAGSDGIIEAVMAIAHGDGCHTRHAQVGSVQVCRASQPE